MTQKPTLTREQIEIIRAEIGHDEVYNLLCDMAIAFLAVNDEIPMTVEAILKASLPNPGR